MKFAWMKHHRDSYPVAVMCRVLDVSKSGFYQWLQSVPSRRARRSQRIRSTVLEIHERSNRIYGSYKIAEVMQTSEQLEIAFAATPWLQRCVNWA